MAIQVNGTTVITNNGAISGGNLTVDSTNAAPTGGAGFSMNAISSDGKFSFGSTNQFLYFDGNSLKYQGSVTVLSDELLQAQGSGFTEITGSATLTGVPSGIYVFVLVGGGSGGCTKNNNRNSNNSWKAHGGSAGGMAILAFQYDGSSALTCTVGGGGGGVTSHAGQGGGGGATTLSLGGTEIARANGANQSGNTGGNGGTGTSNIANNNAIFFSGNSNTSKGRSVVNSTTSASGGAGVVVPTIEAADANLNAAITINNNYAASCGGSMSYNVSIGTGTRNGNLATNAAAAPTILGGMTGAPGSGYGVSGSGNASGGSGGIFAGGGGASGYWNAAAGNAGVGGGGGGARTYHNDYTPVSRAGGAGRLYYKKL